MHETSLPRGRFRNQSARESVTQPSQLSTLVFLGIARGIAASVANGQIRRRTNRQKGSNRRSQTNLQITSELSLSETVAQEMATHSRQSIADRREPITLQREVECDEVYVVAGHKGHPKAVKKGRKGRKRRLKGARGRGTLEKEKPPIFGVNQRGETS